VRTGRLLRLPDDVLLLPSAPARAMRVLAALPQPFTTSEARVAMDSTRRTVIPLLEHLDGRGWTRRLDGSRREVRRST
jgi:selenocysteine-specific elongation factor